jgi:hypothetical protein
MKKNYLFMSIIFWFIPLKPETLVTDPAKAIPWTMEIEDPDYQVLDNWHLCKAKNGIQVSVRWILTSRKSKTRQLLGAIILPVNREQIIRLFTRENSAREWMVFLDELQYYQVTKNPHEWYTYGRINLLGKLASFDVVTDTQLIPGITDDQSVIVMNDAPDFLPAKSGVHRISGLNTRWTLTTMGESQTRVEFMLYTDMKAVIPAWVTDPVITSMMLSTLDQFREKALEGTAP